MQSRPRFAALGHPRFWVATVSLLAVVGMGVVDMDRSLPGPISAVHARAFAADGLAENDCSACHGGWFESLAGACYDCHGEIEQDGRYAKGVHGNLQAGTTLESCGSCHGEHNGPGFQLAGPRSFKLAVGQGPEDFNHDRLGYQIEGAHVDLDCVDCHTAAGEFTLAPGQSRFRGLETSCSSCHSDDHAPVFPQDCTSCHDQDDWSKQRWDSHSDFFLRSGAHAKADCRACHAQGSSGSLEQELGRKGAGFPPVRECAECHEVPHNDGFLEASLGAGKSCVDCHKTDLGDFGSASDRLDLKIHGAAGFALDAPHDEINCSACHAPVGAFSERFLGRSREDCVACHSDPHVGQFAAQDACISCHEQNAFMPHQFGVERHATLRLPLEGAHGEQDCDACHLPLVGEPGASDSAISKSLSFRGTDARCVACHTDAHAEFEFLGEAADNCATCHDDNAFKRAREGFGHLVRTGFKLVGAHAQENCESCHQPQNEPDSTGRSFGRVAELLAKGAGVEGEFFELGQRIEGKDCRLCHQNIHGDGFKGLGTRLESCADCHSQVSFRGGIEDFNHGQATDFALDGKHALLDCTACHLVDPSTARGRAPVKGPDCASCHAEPHAGQFRDSPRGEDCRRCHSVETGFASLVFDHTSGSDFPLSGRHSEIACNDCHTLFESDDAEVRRYWPLENDCSACHGISEGGRLRRSGGRVKGSATDL